MNQNEFKGTWAQGKTEDVINELLDILNNIDNTANMDNKLPWGDTLRQYIEKRIADAFYDLTQLLAHAYASHNWSVEDCEQLTSQRKAGLGLLITKYKLPPNPRRNDNTF